MIFTPRERERLERLGIGEYGGWTVILKRGFGKPGGELDQISDPLSEREARLRAAVLAKRHGLTRKNVKISRESRKIIIDASDFYLQPAISY